MLKSRTVDLRPREKENHMYKVALQPFSFLSFFFVHLYFPEQFVLCLKNCCLNFKFIFMKKKNKNIFIYV